MFHAQARPLVDLTDQIIRENDTLYSGGAFGDVHKCRRRDSSGDLSLVAVKTLRYYRSQNSQRRLEMLKKVLRRELGIWRRLEHPNILPLLGVAKGFGPLDAAVSPWMMKGSLHFFLKNEGRTTSPVERLRLLHGVGSGLQYLHSIPVLHGDLSSANVLIDEDYNPRITDFGLASTIGSLQPGQSYLQRLSSKAGAVRWAAPERLLHGCKLEPSADVYSFGCIMFEVLSGDIPWKDKTDFQVTAFKVVGQNPHPIRAGFADSHWALMTSCWSCPEGRPSAGEVVVVVQGLLSVDNQARGRGDERRVYWIGFFFKLNLGPGTDRCGDSLAWIKLVRGS